MIRERHGFSRAILTAFHIRSLAPVARPHEESGTYTHSVSGSRQLRRTRAYSNAVPQRHG